MHLLFGPQEGRFYTRVCQVLRILIESRFDREITRIAEQTPPDMISKPVHVQTSSLAFAVKDIYHRVLKIQPGWTEIRP